MSSSPSDPDGSQSTRSLLADENGDGFRCPKCSEQLENMDAAVDHVFDAHDPVREFAQRWSR